MHVLAFGFAVVLCLSVVFAVTRFVRVTGEHYNWLIHNKLAIALDLLSTVPFILLFIFMDSVIDTDDNYSTTCTFFRIIGISVFTGIIAGVARFPEKDDPDAKQDRREI